MGYRYDCDGFTSGEKIKVLEERIDKLTDTMTLSNQADTQRQIGSLQIKIASLKRCGMDRESVMDWGVRVSDKTGSTILKGF